MNHQRNLTRFKYRGSTDLQNRSSMYDQSLSNSYQKILLTMSHVIMIETAIHVFVIAQSIIELNICSEIVTFTYTKSRKRQYNFYIK